MIISIRAIPRASRTAVIKDKDCIRVYLTKPADKGMANAQLISLLADYFKVKKYQVFIRKGGTSRNKIIEIVDD